MRPDVGADESKFQEIQPRIWEGNPVLILHRLRRQPCWWREGGGDWVKQGLPPPHCEGSARTQRASDRAEPRRALPGTPRPDLTPSSPDPRPVGSHPLRLPSFLPPAPVSPCPASSPRLRIPRTTSPIRLPTLLKTPLDPPIRGPLSLESPVPRPPCLPCTGSFPQPRVPLFCPVFLPLPLCPHYSPPRLPVDFSAPPRPGCRVRRASWSSTKVPGVPTGWGAGREHGEGAPRVMGGGASGGGGGGGDSGAGAGAQRGPGLAASRAAPWPAP